MSGLEHLERYLKSVANPDKSSVEPLKSERFPFITISREAGAGGHELARELKRRMSLRRDPLFQDWQVLDDELCRMVLAKPGISATLRELKEETYYSEIEDMIRSLVAGSSAQGSVIRETFKIIRLMAFLGKVIVVGRAGAAVTRFLPVGFHLRLVAPLEFRTRRIMQLEGIDKERASKLVLERDRTRGKLVQDYFGEHIENPVLYHLTCNTGLIPVQTIAESVIKMVDMRYKQSIGYVAKYGREQRQSMPKN